MKFLTSLFLSIAIAVVGFLCIPLFVGKCEHTNTYKVYSFQSQTSSAMSYVKTNCRDCYKTLQTGVFYSHPEDKSYLEVMNNGEPFVAGECYTITATVNQASYENDAWVGCEIKGSDVEVYFGVTFRGEYEVEVNSLVKGDVITFRGKASPEGRLYWTDCELITE